MAGYCGYRMSNNAVAAHENGEKPISEWSKKEILERIREAIKNGELILLCSFEQLKKVPKEVLLKLCLSWSSWHHTGAVCNKTNFYDLDFEKIEELTDADLEAMILEYKESKRKEKERKEQEAEKEEKCECSFLIWPKNSVFQYRNRRKGKKYPEPEVITEIGTIKGNWFIRPNGSKKNIYGNGFRIIRTIQ